MERQNGTTENDADDSKKNTTEAKRKWRILTVGDGDLSFSLAVARICPDVELAATTLVKTQQQLIDTYGKSAEECLKGLKEYDNVTIQMDVDATQLHSLKRKFDVIIFNHPHLGYNDLEDESRHASRHRILIAHYLYSASRICSEKGTVHLCLCGDQPNTWKMMESAQRCGLHLLNSYQTSSPPIWLGGEHRPAEKAWAAPRRFRNGKLGSRHYLAKYGYMHRRTYTAKDMDVSNSVHYVFAPSVETPPLLPMERRCTICDTGFETEEELKRHLASPALPDLEEEWKCPDTGRVYSSNYSLQTFQNQIRASHSPSPPPDHGTHLPPLSTSPPSSGPTYTTEVVLEGKRLRWYARQPQAFGHLIRSKSQCDTLIKNGCVALNGSIVTDDARILHVGDVLQLTLREIPSEKNDGVRIVDQKDEFAVVWKPAGMRVCGDFTDLTLESRVSSVLKTKCRSVTRLETGCQGVCLLAKTPQMYQKLISSEMTHVFTALVLGKAPDAWKDGISLPLDEDAVVRHWRKKVKNNEQSRAHNWHSEPAHVFIQCNGTFCTPTLTLSTLQLSSSQRQGRLSGPLTYTLRNMGYTVIGDKFCKREGCIIPRSMKNLLKNKLMIGCFRIVVGGQGYGVEVPDKFRVDYWMKFLGGGG